MQKQKLLLAGITILTSTTAIAGVENYETLPIDTTMSLQEITVRANFLSERNTPLNLTTIKPADVRLHTAAPNYLEMMQGIPGVYATASTGSYGDATLNMRGFKQDNIAILLNGIPIQGITSGSMYWNNWMGLADATYSVQIQKGMGGSMIADCAMGGLVNIITRRSESTPRMEFGASTTNWGTNKYTAGYSSGIMKNGWSFDLLLSYVKGSSYVQTCGVETFSYMLNISKILNDNNTLIFTALGSPEEHDQRNVELSAAEVDRFGRDYSKNWGYLYGSPYSIARNHYAKPYFTLQHIMEGERLSMKNSVYLAIADGGGRSPYSATGAQSIISHQNAEGHIDFDAVIAENTVDGVSKNVILDYLSGHTQAGAIVSADYRLTPEFKLSGGLHYQYYDTWSKMNILDLLGGSKFNLYGTDYHAGDQIGAAYGRTTHHASAYLQGYYESDLINANIGATVFNGNYRRHDDVKNEHSDWAKGWGASVKGGIVVNLSNNFSAYANACYNSRLPYANTYLASSDLSVTKDITNEKNLMGEIGVRSAWNGGGMELSAYLASWKDRTLTVSVTERTNQHKDNYLVKGLNALHKGIELNAWQTLTDGITLKAFASLASWKWTSDANATFYDKVTNEVINETKTYSDGLHVGDAPQTQIGAQIDAKLHRGFYLRAGWQCNSRMYADFDPKNRTNINDKSDSYRLPTANLIDATIGWEGIVMRDVRLNIFANATNLLNTKYIERGTDGKNHDLDTFRGYWGAARTVALGFRLTM